jgi:dihydroorotate dehydrogenase
MNYQALRPLLFLMDPEDAHRLSVQGLRLAGSFDFGRGLLRRTYSPATSQPVDLWGLTFPNPVGLAAGYDKDGDAWRGLLCLGFGHLELGTVTPRPQAGNAKPRIFRLPAHRAAINRLGFPSGGGDVVAERVLGARGHGAIVGINLGKNKETPNEDAAEDYVQLIAKFAPLADYLVVNVSSPNTVGLRRLQSRDALDQLLKAVMEEVHGERLAERRPLPLLVKIAPDLSSDELDDTLTIIQDNGVDGVIATNTTIDRSSVSGDVRASEKGGLSGAPLRARATQVIHQIYRRTDGRLPIIGVGGIASAQDAQEKLDAGASLVQFYTGMIYEGPGLAKRVVEGLSARTSGN